MKTVLSMSTGILKSICVHLAAGSTAAKIVYAITVIIEILRILVANCMCSWVPRVRLRIRASRVLHVWLREFFLVKTAVTSTN